MNVDETLNKFVSMFLDASGITTYVPAGVTSLAVPLRRIRFKSSGGTGEDTVGGVMVIWVPNFACLWGRELTTK